MKKLTMIVAAVLYVFLLGGCSSGNANWDGTFYMEVDEYNSKAFEIVKSGEDYISFTRIDMDSYGGGMGTSSVGGSGAELKNGNTAENNEFRFLLKGDTLTVKSMISDEYYVAYAGKYTRGEPMPVDFEIASDSYYYLDGDSGSDTLHFYDNGSYDYISPDSDTRQGIYYTDENTLTLVDEGEHLLYNIEDDGNVIVSSDGSRFLLGSKESKNEETGVNLSSFYYWDGDNSSDSLYFFGDGTVDYDSPGSETVEGTWSVDGSTVFITLDGDEMECTIEDGGNVITTSDGERMILEGTYSESDNTDGSKELTITESEYYYLNGDEDSDSLYFYSVSNTVDFDSPGMETVEGSYSIDGDTLTITWSSDEETIYSIEDDGSTVISAQGECYYLAE